MIDIIIIAVFALLTFKALVHSFTWFWEKFQINSKLKKSQTDFWELNKYFHDKKSTNQQRLVLQDFHEQCNEKNYKIGQEEQRILGDQQNMIQINKKIIFDNKIMVRSMLETQRHTLKCLKIEQILQMKIQSESIKIQEDKRDIELKQTYLKEDKMLKKKYNTLLNQIQQLKIQRFQSAQSIQVLVKENQSLQKSKFQLAQQFKQTKQKYEYLMIQMQQSHLRELQEQKNLISNCQKVQKMTDQTNIYYDFHNQISQYDSYFLQKAFSLWQILKVLNLQYFYIFQFQKKVQLWKSISDMINQLYQNLNQIFTHQKDKYLEGKDKNQLDQYQAKCEIQFLKFRILNTAFSQTQCAYQFSLSTNKQKWSRFIKEMKDLEQFFTFEDISVIIYSLEKLFSNFKSQIEQNTMKTLLRILVSEKLVVNSIQKHFIEIFNPFELMRNILNKYKHSNSKDCTQIEQMLKKIDQYQIKNGQRQRINESSIQNDVNNKNQ